MVSFRRTLTILFLALVAAFSLAAQSPNVYSLQTGSLTTANASCVATACIRMPVASGTGAVWIQVAGTFSATAQFEGTLDGTNYVAVPAVPVAGGASVTSTTSGGIWIVNAAGLRGVQVRLSAYASGTVAPTLLRSSAGLPITMLTLPTALTVSSLTSSGAVSGTTGTFTGAVSGTAMKPAQIALTSSGGAAALDLSQGNSFKITLSENTTLSASNISAGQTVNALVCQNGTGNFTFTWPASFKGGMTVATTASKCNGQRFICDATACWATAAGSTGM